MSDTNKLPGIVAHIEPFNFPNFLRVAEWKEHTYPVHSLSDEEAAAYWDELKPMWLKHVAEKRKHQKAYLENEAKLVSLQAFGIGGPKP